MAARVKWGNMGGVRASAALSSPLHVCAFRAYTLHSKSRRTAMSTRTERDSMGEMQVPANAHYGASTARAVENFPISPLRFPRRFIAAMGLIKWAAAEVNKKLNVLDAEKAGLLQKAAQEVIDGKLDDQFVVDI